MKSSPMKWQTNTLSKNLQNVKYEKQSPGELIEIELSEKSDSLSSGVGYSIINKDFKEIDNELKKLYVDKVSPRPIKIDHSSSFRHMDSLVNKP